LVATNSIRGGANRAVLDRVCETTRIFEAWSDEPWVNDGAAVRVSLVAFGDGPALARLDGEAVPSINADLSAAHTAAPADDLTLAKPLAANAGTSFSGIQKTGPFELPGDEARAWLRQPNPNGRPYSDVVRPWHNGLDVTRRERDLWIADFGANMPREQAALYEVPFAFVTAHVEPTRVGKREARTNECYWLFQWSRPVMRRALRALPRYTPTTCFETFPFPAGLTPADTAHQRTEAIEGGALIPADLPAAVRAQAGAIARGAKRLVELRDAWLNPPEWTERVSEVVPLGMDRSPYPDRIVARPGFERELARRTLTNLYNQRPAWLAQAHEALDAAVAAAYGWADYTPALADDVILRRLLALNLERAAG
jgi:hypothetical protein